MKSMTFLLDEDDFSRLQKQAEAHERSLGAEIRYLVKKGLKD
jgi:plasmid stability protein